MQLSWPMFTFHIKSSKYSQQQRRKVDIWVITPFCLILHVSKCFFHYSILLRNGSIFENRVKRLTTARTLLVVGKQSKKGQHFFSSPYVHILSLLHICCCCWEIAVKKCYFVEEREKNAVYKSKGIDKCLYMYKCTKVGRYFLKKIAYYWD